VQDAKCSDGALGNRFYKPDEDRAVMLYFNEDEKVAGMAVSVSTMHSYHPWMMEYNGGPIRNVTLGGKSYFSIAVFFREPSSICTKVTSGAASNDIYPIGTGLWLRSGKGFQMIGDYNVKGDPGGSWVKGRCFPSMGIHYWYNITSETAQEDLFPVFLLYNGGFLNAFGFLIPTLPMEDGGNRFEHPGGADTVLFLPDNKKVQPKSIVESTHKLSTVHVAFQNPIQENFCDEQSAIFFRLIVSLVVVLIISIIGLCFRYCCHSCQVWYRKRFSSSNDAMTLSGEREMAEVNAFNAQSL
jgi:hypothetical protein